MPKSPFAMLLPDQPGLDAEIRRIAHVVAIAPRLDFQGLISNGESSLSFRAQRCAAAISHIGPHT